MSLKHFTRETFEKELNGGALMLVDFWAAGSCQQERVPSAPWKETGRTSSSPEGAWMVKVPSCSSPRQAVR